MAGPQEIIQKLRAALQSTPENVVLREYLADTLLAHGHAEEAETELRVALQTSPDSASIRLGLARCFLHQQKYSHALVVAEDLLNLERPPPGIHLLYARLMLRAGETRTAEDHYLKAVAADPSIADKELALQIGLEPHETDPEILDGRIRTSVDAPVTNVSLPLERSTLRFDDVGGMESVKEEIRIKILYPLQRPDLYKAYGKTIGGGILLYGPPGCGKTYLARATAGELGASFLTVGIDEIVDMWLGQSEKNLHAIFESARANTPSVLFFDEVDALGAKRSDMRQSAGRQVINQFLAELDGAKSSNEGVLVLAATNAPWHLDGAFRRPGRFDRVIFVPPPDEAARSSILRLHLRGKPVSEIDLERVSRKTEGFSGADLKAVVDLAIEEKLREAMATGRLAPVTTANLLSGVKRHRPTTKDWFASARNYALYANADGLYDEIRPYLD